MSLILEALRKSEAERRRGQTPDLLSDALPAAAAVRRPQANWALGGAVATAAALTLLVVAWWLRSPADAPSAAADAMGAAPDARPSPVAEATAPEPDPQPLQPPQSQASLPPPGVPSRAPTLPAPTAAAPPPAATTAPPATTAPAPAPTVAMPATIPAPRATPVPPDPINPGPALPTPQQVAALDTAPAARASTPAFASPEMPVKLSDLSAEDRQQLPTLKVSMHMWAPDAGSRFAIIDGTRVNEGDRVGDATVDAILQDGVMLSWHGRQIRLPIR